MATKKKTVRTRTRVTGDRSWRRDLLARDIFTALVVKHYGEPRDQSVSTDRLWQTLADTALFAAHTFELHRAEFGGKRK